MMALTVLTNLAPSCIYASLNLYHTGATGTFESKEKLDPTGEIMSDWFCRSFILLMKQRDV